MSRATARYDDLDRAHLTFPFNPIFISEIKERVPVWARSYTPATRTWAIHPPYDEPILARMESWFPDLEIIPHRPAGQRQPPPPSPQAPKPTPHATLFLLPTAPREVIDACYRALVKLHHPDRLPAPERAAGTERMKALNSAYAQLTEAR